MKGFTLIEVLLVILIVTLISGFGIISLSRLQTIFKLRSSADEVRAMIEYGRELAVANKDQAGYSLSLSGNIFVLRANVAETKRFQSPAGIVFSPASFTWNFTPLTGTIPTCSPCQLMLTSGGVNEVISVQENGLVN